MLAFSINYQNFMILFGSFISFFAFVYGISKAIGLLKEYL